MPTSKTPKIVRAPRRKTVMVESRDQPRHDAIALRAYELFIQRGGEHGRDWEDWLSAERDLGR